MSIDYGLDKGALDRWLTSAPEPDELADAGAARCATGRCGECDACIDEGDRLYDLEVGA